MNYELTKACYYAIYATVQPLFKKNVVPLHPRYYKKIKKGNVFHFDYLFYQDNKK